MGYLVENQVHKGPLSALSRRSLLGTKPYLNRKRWPWTQRLPGEQRLVDNGPAARVIDFEAGVAIARTIYAIARSSREGGRSAWAPRAAIDKSDN